MLSGHCRHLGDLCGILLSSAELVDRILSFRKVFDADSLFPLDQEWPRQTKPKKGQFHELFPGTFRNKKFNVNRACFLREKHPNSQKMGEIHELFVLALSLVWFAGATPEGQKGFEAPSGTKLSRLHAPIWEHGST